MYIYYMIYIYNLYIELRCRIQVDLDLKLQVATLAVLPPALLEAHRRLVDLLPAFRLPEPRPEVRVKLEPCPTALRGS